MLETPPRLDFEPGRGAVAEVGGLSGIESNRFRGKVEAKLPFLVLEGLYLRSRTGRQWTSSSASSAYPAGCKKREGRGAPLCR